MKLIRETDQRFVNLERKIGLFAGVALLALVILVIYQGISHDIFTPKARLGIQVQSATGISTGQPVTLCGFKIGKVGALSLNEAGRVEVELLINRRYLRWIRSDSRVRLNRNVLMGDSSVEILPGTLSLPEMKEGTELSFERGPDLNEMVMSLNQEIRRVVEQSRLGTVELAAFTRGLNDPQGEFRQGMGEVLKGTREMAAFLQNLNDPNEDYRRILGHVRALSLILRRTAARTAPQIPGLVTRGRETLEEAGDVAAAIKKTWPISSHVEPARPRQLEWDSDE